MKIVADSSPLIALAKIGCFDLLEKLFGRLIVTSEVYAEVVEIGAGLPGAKETKAATWIQVQSIDSRTDWVAVQTRFRLDIGELSTLVLAKEISADLVLVDDLAARKLMMAAGFRIQGTIGVLEACFERGHLLNLRQVYGQLLETGVYLDRSFLNSRLHRLRLEPL